MRPPPTGPYKRSWQSRLHCCRKPTVKALFDLGISNGMCVSYNTTSTDYIALSSSYSPVTKLWMLSSYTMLFLHNTMKYIAWQDFHDWYNIGAWGLYSLYRSLYPLIEDCIKTSNKDYKAYIDATAKSTMKTLSIQKANNCSLSCLLVIYYL